MDSVPSTSVETQAVRGRPGLSDDPLWYKDAVIYQLHVRGYFDGNDDGVGDFAGLTSKLDYIQSLGVSAVWLQPFYPSPLKDDGYDIADFEQVHKSYGTRADFLRFLNDAHERGLRVITELVINHTSDQHAWFQAARRAPRASSKRRYYVWSDNDRGFADAPIIFKDTERSNWTWDPVAGQYYWHRFFHHQPDLNFDHPRVRKAVLRVMRYWMGMGVDGMRLDAVPYLVEREGTQCANLPETHAILKEIRRDLDQRFKNRMLLAEANQWPSDVRAYFGDNDECHMAFHFPLMPRLFMALRQEDRHPLSEILYQMPEIPDACQWAIFLRNHDELTLEMVGDEERDYMYQAYAADPQMRLNLGIRRRLAPLMENSRPRIELMNGLLLSLPGTPVLYYGDEIGMGDNIYLGDRNGVRTPMQWNADRNGGFSRADPARLYAPVVMDSVFGYQAINVEAQERTPHSLLGWTRRMITLRQRHPVFGRGAMELLRPANRQIFAFIRRLDPNDPVLVVANLSRTVQGVSLDLSRVAGLFPVEMAGGGELPRITEAPYFLTLGPYAFYWLKLQRDVPAPAADRRAPAVIEQRPELAPILAGPEWWKLLDGSVRQLIERRYLPSFLPRQPWFEARQAPLAHVTIADWGTLRRGEEPVFLIVITAAFSDAVEARYAIAMAATPGARGEHIAQQTPDTVVARIAGARTGVLHTRLDSCIGNWLLGAVAEGRTTPLHGGRLRGMRLPAFDALSLPDSPQDLPSEPFAPGRQHTSVAFGERLVVKNVARMWPGVSPERELSEFLRGAGNFPRVPSVAGAVEYETDGSEAAAIALVKTFVPHQNSGWRDALGELDRFFDLALTLDDIPAAPHDWTALWTTEIPTAAQHTVGAYLQTAASIGRRTAELHAALASDAAAEALGRAHAGAADIDAMTERVATAWQRTRAALAAAPQANETLQKLAQRIVDQHDLILETIKDTRQRIEDGGLLTRIHCSLDLAHVLLFEGDATFIGPGDDSTRTVESRRRLRSPLEDVANLLRSFQSAAEVALEARLAAAPQDVDRLAAWTRWWLAWTATAFLGTYRASGGAGTAAGLSDTGSITALIRLFLFEHTFDDLRSALHGSDSGLSAALARAIALVTQGTGFTV